MDVICLEMRLLIGTSRGHSSVDPYETIILRCVYYMFYVVVITYQARVVEPYDM